MAKRLSESQARRCEEARTARCRCRCGGLMHGAKRIPADAPRGAYEALPPDDPHQVAPERQRRIPPPDDDEIPPED
jgi:hypothetical protein